jgi:hypothetical protein
MSTSKYRKTKNYDDDYYYYEDSVFTAKNLMTFLSFVIAGIAIAGFVISLIALTSDNASTTNITNDYQNITYVNQTIQGNYCIGTTDVTTWVSLNNTYNSSSELEATISLTKIANVVTITVQTPFEGLINETAALVGINVTIPTDYEPRIVAHAPLIGLVNSTVNYFGENLASMQPLGSDGEYYIIITKINDAWAYGDYYFSTFTFTFIN